MVDKNLDSALEVLDLPGELEGEPSFDSEVVGELAEVDFAVVQSRSVSAAAARSGIVWPSLWWPREWRRMSFDRRVGPSRCSVCRSP